VLSALRGELTKRTLEYVSNETSFKLGQKDHLPIT
jgi:hypothetical protein